MSEAAAAWPDDVVEAVAVASNRLCAGGGGFSACGQGCYCADRARAALAALAPYLAAREAAARIAGWGDAGGSKIGGWAEGGYLCRCHVCTKLFEGDKRAIQCRPCATAALPPPPGGDALAERIASARDEWPPAAVALLAEAGRLLAYVDRAPVSRGHERIAALRALTQPAAAIRSAAP